MASLGTLNERPYPETAGALPRSSRQPNLRIRLLPVFDRVRRGFVFDDMNRGFLGGCCASANTDVLSDQLCLCIFAKPPVRRHKSTRSRASNLASLLAW